MPHDHITINLICLPPWLWDMSIKISLVTQQSKYFSFDVFVFLYSTNWDPLDLFMETDMRRPWV